MRTALIDVSSQRDMYFLVFLHLGTRRCWISPATVHPDSAWSCQQARNFLMHAENVHLPPKSVLRDNNAKYTPQYDAAFKSSDAEIVKDTPQSSNLRARDAPDSPHRRLWWSVD